MKTRNQRLTRVKIIVVGGFGAGKSAWVSSVSQMPQLTTEETITARSAATDDLSGLANKRTTTVSMDFGKRRFGDDLVLYLFGVPGQDRFRESWELLAHGAFGAVVMVDTRRIQDSWDSLDFIEQRRLPYVVAINRFPDTPGHPIDRVREKLDQQPGIPIVECDARREHEATAVLKVLVRHMLYNLTTSHS